MPRTVPSDGRFFGKDGNAVDVTALVQGWTESLTKYIGQIDSDHAYIHEGLAFTYITSQTISEAYRVSFTTPSVASDKIIHWRPTGITSSANYVQVTLYENTVYASGADVVPFNRNRNSAKTTELQALALGTTRSGGDIIQVKGVGTSGNPQARSGGGTFASEELMLKPNTNYTLELVPAGVTSVVLELFWYEELNGAV